MCLCVCVCVCAVPWFAARVADAVRRQAARGAPYASIAIELPPSQHTSMAACAELLHPVLEELAHTRFARMPDLRALQRITGTDTRERVGAELESHGLEPASMLLFGFIEGMELLQVSAHASNMVQPAHAHRATMVDIRKVPCIVRGRHSYTLA